MSEYQRFISYMYEYRSGKKSTNCGYARVENRNRLCRLEIHMKTSPQTLEEPLRIYGCFHRDGQLFGVLLGQHAPVLDMVNWRYQGDPDNLNASMVPLSQLEGLILSDGSQIAYCSMWNDTVVDPSQMTPYVKEKPESPVNPIPEQKSEVSSDTPASSERIPKENKNVLDFIQADPPESADLSPGDSREAIHSSQADTTGSMDISPDSVDIPSDPVDISPEDGGNTQSLQALAQGNENETNDGNAPDAVAAGTASADGIVSAAASLPSDDAAPDGATTDMAYSEEDSGEPPLDIRSDEQIPGDAAGNIPSRDQPPAGDASNGMPDSLSPADAASSGRTGSGAQVSPSRTPESSPADFALAFQQKQAGRNPTESAADGRRSSSPWEQVQAAYPQINPFTDDEIQDCVRIELTDLPTLRQNGWRIAGNRFILHSFQKNRHLILGRLKNNGRYIFAVPGYYDNQERFMANMFGFPYFKSSDGGPLRYGQKGYWYRLLY